LGDVIGLSQRLNIPVRAHLDEALGDGAADVVLHSTGSTLTAVLPQIEECVRAGLHLVSTCEELSYPTAQYPDLVRNLDTLAKEHGVAIMGTGINPGYTMDALPLFLSAVCQRVDRVRVQRVLDAGTRRLPLQQKIGAGASVPEFQKLVEAKRVRHVGLLESATMVADGLGWKLSRVEEVIEPVVAERVLRSEYLEVQPGRVAGVHQVARGYADGREILTLDLTIALGVEDPGDLVQIWGVNDVEMRVKGIHGDQATAAVVVNSVPRIIHSQPGLLTMKDIAPPCCWSSVPD
jgi:4-hydroxy-tetrahydrodipicolinate reductase